MILNNKFYINVDLKDRNDFYNKYNNKDLSTDLCEYIDEKQKQILINSKIILNFNLKYEVDEEEKITMTNIIRRHYYGKIKQINSYVKYNQIKDVLLLFFGVASIIFSEILAKYLTFVIPEIFSIAGWVAIWEVIYALLFTNIRKRIETRIYRKLMRAEINFFYNE